jgi:hypothetical protein
MHPPGPVVASPVVTVVASVASVDGSVASVAFVDEALMLPVVVSPVVAAEVAPVAPCSPPAHASKREKMLGGAILSASLRSPTTV